MGKPTKRKRRQLTPEEQEEALRRSSELQRQLSGAGGPGGEAPAGGETATDAAQLERDKLAEIRAAAATGADVDTTAVSSEELAAIDRAVNTYTAELSSQIGPDRPLTEGELYTLSRLNVSAAAVITPQGRAPRGEGATYTTRRQIARRITAAERTVNARVNEASRPQNRGRDVYTSNLTSGAQHIRRAVSAATQIATGPGDWLFKQELINGMLDQVTAEANMMSGYGSGR
jgi:hypothetical protein